MSEKANLAKKIKQVSEQPEVIEMLPELSAEDTSYFEMLDEVCADKLQRDVRCKMCNLDQETLDEAHDVWEKHHKFIRVRDFLQSKGYNFSEQNVSTHISQHLLASQQAAMVRHSSQRIEAFLRHRLGHAKLVERMIAGLYMKWMVYASTVHEDTDKAVKADLASAAISKQIMELQRFQRELEGEMTPAKVVIERVQQIFVSTIQKTQRDPQVKMELLKALEEIRRVEGKEM